MWTHLKECRGSKRVVMPVMIMMMVCFIAVPWVALFHHVSYPIRCSNCIHADDEVEEQFNGIGFSCHISHS
jgi:hypothetical protein